jgi:predicted RNA binding protein YcfA (HicA-like mRNA interferase family)
MPKLPVVSGRDAVRAFERYGYEVHHQTGSHIILRRREAPYRRLTVPDHHEIARGTLRSLIREAGLSVEAFCELL